MISAYKLSFAVVEIVPLLKPVLGRVLPLMGAVKLDNMQWVFANGGLSLTHDAIVHYLGPFNNFV